MSGYIATARRVDVPDLPKALEEPQTQARNPRLWKIAAAVLVVIAIAGLSLWIVLSRGEVVQYTTEPAIRDNLVVTVSATGTLQPTNQVEISSEISGRIERVAVDYNDTVRVGQVLASLDPSRLQAQVHQSQAALESAKAKVMQAQASLHEAKLQTTRLSRMHELTSGSVPSQSDLDAAQANEQRAEADLASFRALAAQSQATLDAQRADLAKSVIRSPIDGLVLKRAVEPGQTVAATLQAPVLFVLAENLAQMELHVDVDEADVSSLRAGQRATFTVDAYPDRVFSAQVTQVHYGPQTVSGVVTYETVLKVDNSSLELRPGMTATAEVVVEELSDVLLIPNAALRFTPTSSVATEPAQTGKLVDRLLPRPPMRGQRQRAPSPGTPQVWTLRDGEPSAISVQIGASDGFHTQLAQGDLKPGTELIVDARSVRR